MTVLHGTYKVALKRVSEVEASRDRSNQHEFNGSRALRTILGPERLTSFPGKWVFLSDEGGPSPEDLVCSWYDARERNEERAPEWRLYFTGSPPMSAGDLLVLVLREGDPNLFLIVATSGSSWETQLIGLFGNPDTRGGRVVEGQLNEIPFGYAAVAQELFDLLGWTERSVPPTPGDLDLLLAKFGETFPTTDLFSAFARELEPGDPADPDRTLMAWWEREESLFRTMEDHLLQARLSQAPPFRTTDEFVAFSLSVQNRRKSRAGHAFEHHVAALLSMHGIRHTRTPRTEGDRRPDFILPGINAYRDNRFIASSLTMLATKTTCKDRWRQVLNEAQRIPEKHLATLEAGISAAQLREMREEKVVLVAPAALHATFPSPARDQVMTVSEFLSLAGTRQAAAETA